MFVRGPFPEDYECEEKEDAASFFVVGGDAPLQPPPMRQESRNLLYFRAVSREGLRGEKRKRSGKVAGDIQVWRGGALKKMHFVGRRREWCKRVFGGATGLWRREGAFKRSTSWQAQGMVREVQIMQQGKRVTFVSGAVWRGIQGFQGRF